MEICLMCQGRGGHRGFKCQACNGTGNAPTRETYESTFYVEGWWPNHTDAIKGWVRIAGGHATEQSAEQHIENTFTLGMGAPKYRIAKVTVTTEYTQSKQRPRSRHALDHREPDCAHTMYEVCERCEPNRRVLHAGAGS